MTDGISVADALALRNSGMDGACNDGMFGGNGAWWIIILILFGLGGGWGRNGYGNDGGNFSACCAPATAQGMTDAFNFSQLDNGIRGLERGLCDGFYSLSNAINNCCCNTQYNMAQGFNGLDKTVLQGDFHNQAGFNALGNQMAAACCDLSRGQENIQHVITKAVGELAIAGERNTNEILNYLNKTETDKLRTELQSAQFQLSQLSQTRSIIEQLLPVAKPAYLTCSPYAAAFGTTGYNPTCGCGC